MQIVFGFDDTRRAEVARMFWAAFSDKLGMPLGPASRGEAYIARALQPRFAICAFEGDRLLGVAGFKTSEGGLVGGSLSDLASVYGWLGALWRGLVLDQLERSLAAEQLLMDGIFVAESARGRGVGTALLRTVVAHARGRGYCELKLDVIDSNHRARELYERNGFVASGSVTTGPFRFLFGFREATTMVYQL